MVIPPAKQVVMMEDPQVISQVVMRLTDMPKWDQLMAKKIKIPKPPKQPRDEDSVRSEKRAERRRLKNEQTAIEAAAAKAQELAVASN
jgi:hypothetical protein